MPDKRIHLLSEKVTNKIAAGEVVERPASVLKELIENAIDAGADQIDVEVVEGGRRGVLVCDNGRGMGPEDALMSIQRYATSKISDVDDIERIATMGFRGEALAAISSVARCRLVTRPNDADEGTEIRIAGGKVQSVETVGAPPGTCVEVRNMFFNVPARKKFMRTARTEFSHIRQRFLVYALAHPEIGMTLTSDENAIYSLRADDTLEQRIEEIYGDSLAGALRRVDFSGAEVCVRGYVALPRASRSDRSEQYIFINNRPATAPVLAYAIREGYHTLLPQGRYPMLFLFIDLDPALVDVNVHPTKREVRFRHSNQLRDSLIEAIRSSLETPPRGDSGQVGAGVVEGLAAGNLDRPSGIRIDDLPATPVFRYPRMPMLDERGIDSRPAGRLPEDQEQATLDGTGEPPWSQCRVLGQVGGLFVVLETEDGMVLMDPHAAHERVMYEKFMDQVHSDKVRSQGLLYPETLEMSPDNAEIIRKNEAELKGMGFGISSFGGDSFIVDSVPACLGQVSISAVVEEMAKVSEHSGGLRASLEHGARERIAMAACKAAVKGGDRLTLSEIETLVNDLARSRMPYTCPHGRPTVIFMGFRDLLKKFGRITP